MIQKKVKCHYCDKEIIIEKKSQRSFVCCDHKQLISSALIETRNIIDDTKNTDDKIKNNTDTLNTDGELNKFLTTSKNFPVNSPSVPSVSDEKEEEFEVEENKQKEIVEKKVNPDDFDYECGKCHELFNDDGNSYIDDVGKKIIICPDCKSEWEK